MAFQPPLILEPCGGEQTSLAAKDIHQSIWQLPHSEPRECSENPRSGVVDEELPSSRLCAGFYIDGGSVFSDQAGRQIPHPDAPGLSNPASR